MTRKIVFFSILFFCSCGSYARQIISYAGQSYSADQRLLPYTSAALSKLDNLNLNQQVIDRISSNPKYEFVTFNKDSDSRDYGKATVLALSLDNEIVSVEKIDGKYKLLYELSAQALYVDFFEKQVLGSFPFTLAYVDLFPVKPSDKQIQESVNEYLLRPNNNPLVTEFTKVVNRYEIPQAASKRFRIRSIEFSEEAAGWVPGSISPDNLKIIYGYEFSKYISTHLNLPVLPPSEGRAIKNEMSATFTNADRFNFKIPEEDYAISLKINWFKKLVASKNNVAIVYVFGAGTEIQIYEPFQGQQKPYFNSPMKLGATKTAPITQENIDDWAAISAVMNQLFDEFAKNIRNPDKAWMKTHFGTDKSKEIGELNRLIKDSKYTSTGESR